MRWSATCRKEKETDKSLQITERSQDKKCTQKNIGHFFDIWVMPKMAVMSHMLRGKCVRTKALSNLLIPVENTVHYMTLAALSAASCASLLCTNKVKKMHEHFSHVFFLSSHFCYFFFFFWRKIFFYLAMPMLHMLRMYPVNNGIHCAYYALYIFPLCFSDKCTDFPVNTEWLGERDDNNSCVYVLAQSENVTNQVGMKRTIWSLLVSFNYLLISIAWP